ncbi:MAG: carbamoyl-phosphate synthase large subunit, partial [Ruminococcaceae bacterium]|nr:carbamoyl-phosphate synthase large subunit [Oscillospiraceae bacterium]
MPLYKELKKVMLIGSGPIVIGQAAEFDYAGTQACKVLKDLGLSVVLVNPNPATIMTDSVIADRIYIEPLNLDVLKRIIEAENPDGLISTIGGQMGLTLSMQLAKDGFLAQHNVRLLGASLETIDNAEDRLLFKQTMESIDQPIIPSDIVTDLPAAVKLAKKIGYPVIVRPAFTLGGAGGGIAKNEAELREIAKAGLDESPITQILVEKCISGWKGIEFEVMRDSGGNVIAVCSMENLDPVGVHTGDSIVVAPAVTLSNTEYQMLRTAALRIIQKLEVNGGCNVQFALHPESIEYAVIEVNPRVSRSSALASKATGYPIAKVAAQIAVGLHLVEIENAVTKKTTAFFEPTIDYIVVKFPKWPFDKFVGANRTLGTQMKATGEVMSIGTTFENALLKAVRGAEIKQETLNLSPLKSLSDKEIRELLSTVTDERIFVVYEALLRGITVDEIHAATMIDEWFLYKLLNIAALEKRLMGEKLTEELYVAAKKYGFTDRTIEAFSKQKIKKHLPAGYKMVDTCAAEFEAATPYFYSSYAGENEAAEFIKAKKSGKKTVIVFGSGPIRIGQGIEFDYTSVHCVWTLKELGYEVVMVNNNPETVSTDFDTSDRLYFEPLYPEDVLDILAVEKPFGAVVAFGGQTAINLTKTLKAHNIKILGTSADAIDAAEDREKFDAILNELKIERPQGKIVATKAEALSAASKLGYPVLVRPSYVLGGKNMIIAFSDADINEYMDIILASSEDNTILVDKYLSGTEVEVDAICDG